MKGMDMMATRGVMPLGVEQANVLQAPSVAGDGQGMSFAKSFGDVAAAGVELAGQMLKGNTVPLAKGSEAPAGSMELLNISVGEGWKATSTSTNTPLAKNRDAGMAGAQSVSAQSSEKPGNVPQRVSVVGGNGATLQSVVIDVSVGASPVSNEKPVGPIADEVGNQEAGTKIDSVPIPFTSKVASQPLASEEGRSAVLKKETVAVSAVKLGADKATKKELKDKGDFSAAAIDSQNVSMPAEGPGTQVVMTVPVGAVPLFAAKAQAMDTAEGDSNTSAASGQMVGIAGAKAVKGSPYGANSGVVGTSASGGSKDGTVAAAKADDGVAGMKKDEMDSSKTVTGVASANGLNEGATHGSGGAVAVPMAHGVFAVTGNVAGDAVTAKASVNANSVATAAGQDGGSQSAASVSEGHRTLEATPTSLEVGVANGTQGWLKIRAEMTDSGVVNASVSATTSTGQEMLHRELPSLTAYLQQEQIGVGSLVLHTTGATGSQEFAGGMERDAGREQMQQRGDQEGESKQDASGTTFSDSGEAYIQGGLSGIAEITTNTVYAGGSWLSVRA